MNTPPRPDQQIDPPPAVLHPGGAAGTFRGRLVVIFGSSTNGSTGLFVYSPTPAAGNLVASIAAVGGTDPYGNAYLTGVVSYDKVHFTAASLTGGVLNIWTATSEAGPWTQRGQLAASGADMVLQSNRDILADQPVGLLDQTAPTAVSGRARLFAITGGWVQYVADSAGDGNTYTTGHLSLLAAGQTFSSLTPANITGWSCPVAIGTYIVRGTLAVGQGGASSNQAIQITGPTASAVSIKFLSVEGATIFNSGVVSALSANIATGAVTNGTTGEMYFTAIITFSAAGTLQMTGLCVGAAANTWTIGANSLLEVSPA